MGDVVVRREIRFGTTGSGRLYNLYFDTGSPFSFVRLSIALRTHAIMRIPSRPKRFRGMGNGSFVSTHICYFETRLLGVWCAHTAFVLEDNQFEKEHDFLIGHDFMQRLDIGLNPRRKRLILHRAALERSTFVR